MSNTLRLGLVAGLALLTAGCAGTHISNVSTTAAAGRSAPSELLVAVSVPSGTYDDQAGRISPILQKALVTQLNQAGFRAEAGGAALSPGAAVLKVDVLGADPGNRLKRLVVGFGRGKSVLTLSAHLETSGQAVMGFDAESDSGRKPGLLLPGAVAAATGKVVNFVVVGGARVALEPGDDLDHDAARSAKAIVAQVKAYYQANGWAGPRPV